MLGLLSWGLQHGPPYVPICASQNLWGLLPRSRHQITACPTRAILLARLIVVNLVHLFAALPDTRMHAPFLNRVLVAKPRGDARFAGKRTFDQPPRFREHRIRSEIARRRAIASDV